jgi:hypothetical protein
MLSLPRFSFPPTMQKDDAHPSEENPLTFHLFPSILLLIGQSINSKQAKSLVRISQDDGENTKVVEDRREQLIGAAVALQFTHEQIVESIVSTTLEGLLPR